MIPFKDNNDSQKYEITEEEIFHQTEEESEYYSNFYKNYSDTKINYTENLTSINNTTIYTKHKKDSKNNECIAKKIKECMIVIYEDNERQILNEESNEENMIQENQQ